MEALGERNLPEKLKIKWNSTEQLGYSESYSSVSALRELYKIIAEPIGTPKLSRRQNKVLIKPFLLSKYEVFYLYEINAIEIDNLKEDDDNNFDNYFKKSRNDSKFSVYKDLKTRGFYVTSGFKYGADFLLYREDPNFIHSEFLVYVKKIDAKISISEILKEERISVSNKKKLMTACVDEFGGVKYFNLEWINI